MMSLKLPMSWASAWTNSDNKKSPTAIGLKTRLIYLIIPQERGY